MPWTKPSSRDTVCDQLEKVFFDLQNDEISILDNSVTKKLNNEYDVNLLLKINMDIMPDTSKTITEFQGLFKSLFDHNFKIITNKHRSTSNNKIKTRTNNRYSIVETSFIQKIKQFFSQNNFMYFLE